MKDGWNLTRRISFVCKSRLHLMVMVLILWGSALCKVEIKGLLPYLQRPGRKLESIGYPRYLLFSTENDEKLRNRRRRRP